MTQQLINDLARAKAEFQLRGILAALGIDQPIEEAKQCEICGDHDCIGGRACETGDGE